MNLERKLQINLALMVALGSGLLAIAQSNYGLPLVGVASAFVALIFTDIRRSFRLNRLLANTVALAAVVVVLLEFVTAAERNQLYTIANLLISLQIILLFLEKTPRIYGNLAVLSLFQVAVSTAMNVGVEFGILLLAYMVVAVSFLAMLFNFRTLRSVAPARPKSAPGRPPQEQPATPVSSKPLTLLFGQPPRAQFIYREAEFSQQLTGWRLPRQIAGICFATLLFSVILFFSLPRANQQSSPLIDPSRTVGMPASRVALDEMRNIIVSETPVLQVHFKDAVTGEPYRVYGDLYLRGIILDHYIKDERGTYLWRSSPDEATTRVADPPRGAKGVLQHIVLQPQQTSTLFSVYPAYRAPFTPQRLMFDRNNKRLVRAPSDTQVPANGMYSYQIFTTGLRNNLQQSVTPHELRTMYPAGFDDEFGFRGGRRRFGFFREGFEDEISHLRFISRSRFPNICRLADEVVEELRLTDPEPDAPAIARALQNHFLFSTDYTYSLKFAEIERTPEMDPIEDFVANHRTGHCEYFASALILALRSQGIPARMVVGYRGGEYNSLGHFYQIRQSNAHAWVEAYLEPEQVDQSQRPTEPSPYGYWLRLDPTPSGSDQDVWDQGGLLAWANDAYGFARLMWMDYVVNMDSQRQQDAIYSPLVNSSNQGAELFSLGGDETDTDSETAEPPDTAQAASIWQFVAGVVVMLIAVVAAYRLSRSIRGLLKRRAKEKAEEQLVQGRRGEAVPFYERFTELLARLHLARSPSQTQSEFADYVSGRLAVTPELTQLAPVPRRVADAFYDVRFGGRSLSPQRLAEIEQDLDQLDAAVTNAGQNTPKSPATASPPRDKGRTSTTAS